MLSAIRHTVAYGGGTKAFKIKDLTLEKSL